MANLREAEPLCRLGLNVDATENQEPARSC